MYNCHLQFRNSSSTDSVFTNNNDFGHERQYNEQLNKQFGC